MKLAVTQLNGIRELHHTLIFSFSGGFFWFFFPEIIISLSAFFFWLRYGIFQDGAVKDYDVAISVLI